MTTPTEGLFKFIDKFEDHRQSGKVIHELRDVLLLTISAVIAGAEGWEDIVDFGHYKLDWLKNFGNFSAGIPSADTVARIIQHIDATQFRRFFAAWMKQCHRVTSGEVIAVDGKTLRAACNKNDPYSVVHMVSAFATANGVVLAQIKTDSKSNEITAIPELLNLLNLKGCLVTIDAMGCQKSIAQKILDQRGDYLLQVKGNHPKLFALLQEEYSLVTLQNSDLYALHIHEKSHGRQECRSHLVIPIKENSKLQAFAEEWPGIKSLCIEILYIYEPDGTVKEMPIRYFISSAQLSVKRFALTCRKHWHIENKLHWSLDVAMNEDRSRIRVGEAPAILAGMRHIALNLLRKSTVKMGIRRKQRRAFADETYLTEVMMTLRFDV